MPDSLKTIAGRLERTRLALGFDSQEAFGLTLGYGKGTYNPWETGERRISLDAAIRLREVHKISLDWTYCGDPSGLPVKLYLAISQAA